MFSDLTSLSIGDKIYTRSRIYDTFLITTITGETPTVWTIQHRGQVSRVRKKDGYLMGSSSPGRGSPSIYYDVVTPEILEQYRCQVLRSKINNISAERILITPETYAEISAAVEVLVRYMPA